MRKIVLFMHVSLDGFVGGPNGEMDWINVDDELFDYAGKQTDRSDTALYGRVTYEMMQGYWPTAGEQPTATRHDKEHSAWYNRVEKVVISKTMQGALPPKTKIMGKHLAVEIGQLKQAAGKDILIFGSPSASHSLMAENLIDQYRLFVNPVLLGNGIPLFKEIKQPIKLKLLKTDTLSSGVVCLHYEKLAG